MLTPGGTVLRKDWEKNDTKIYGDIWVGMQNSHAFLKIKHGDVQEILDLEQRSIHHMGAFYGGKGLRSFTLKETSVCVDVVSSPRKLLHVALLPLFTLGGLISCTRLTLGFCSMCMLFMKNPRE